ncbi:MAG: protein kinase, partial [Gemmatimonadetes bacterium]|nr:protein kinase [Gemmatimonadota bacterium]
MTALSSEFLGLQGALAGEYSIERELGRGGMGIVYLARDVQLDRDVAIKVLPMQLARDPESRERFLREARTAAGLSHPHIVPIHRVGEAGGYVFFVMSYVAGETLGERLRATGPLPPAETMRVMREVAWALAYAHGRGIVHRDVKPDNILLETGTGRALVTDFGIAHGTGAAGPATDPGRIMGTAHFMSPEQAASEPLDGRSDIYSLGVVGYLAASGRLPFESPNLPALLVRQATEAAPPVMAAAPGMPPALANAIDRCLDRDVSRRFADGEALAAALAPVADSRPALPASLRAWLAARNPALAAYSLWSGMLTIGTLGQTVEMISRGRYDRFHSVLGTAALAMAPLIPIVGFQLNQAYRLFRAGYTLGDLRMALDVGERERQEGESLAVEDKVRPLHALVRVATYFSAAMSGVAVWLAVKAVIAPGRTAAAIMTPVIATMVLAATCNALEVPLMPAFIRNRLQAGLRERLWHSRAGAWLARRLGAPTR